MRLLILLVLSLTVATESRKSYDVYIVAVNIAPLVARVTTLSLVPAQVTTMFQCIKRVGYRQHGSALLGMGLEVRKIHNLIHSHM